MAGRVEILPGIFIRDLGIFLEDQNILAIADVHLGYEEALNKQGILVPREQFENTVKRIEPLLKEFSPETVVVNGDLKHEFGRISDQEWKDVLKFVTLLRRYAQKIVLIEGNHDKILGPLAEKKGLETHSHFKSGTVLFLHGDEEPDKKLLDGVETIIIGHEHPAVSLREGERVEQFKCWLLGRWQQKNLVVMPSFNLVTEGSDVLREKQLSPLLQDDIESFEAFLVDDTGDLLKFGKLCDLK